MTDTASEGERANPYVGLRPFFFEDSLYFFGRDRQTNDLLTLLRHNRFLGVVGSSGSGKSSLVRAGLLPMLLGGFLESERDSWALAQVKPGDTPLVNLVEGLIRATGETATPDAIAALVDDIGDRHVEAVTDFLGSRVASSNILLLVDQFEELFAFRNKVGDSGPNQARERAQRRSEASAYVDLMLRLAEYPGLPIYVVLTMRTDFLGDCDLFYGLPEALNIGRYLVPRLSRDELREAVECPAVLAGASVAPRLLDQILNALGDRMDRLPVVQHALVRTFDEWVRHGRQGPIDLAHYEAVGGLERALNNDADAAMAGLDARDVEAIFRRLTDTDINQRRVRSPARISELMAVAGVGRDAIDAVIAPFADRRRSFLYLSNDGNADDQRVDIAHESLIRNWDRLVGWCDTEQQERDTYVGLTDRARRWRAGTGSALEGPERRSAIAWVTATNPKRGWARRHAEADDDFDTLFAYLNASQKSFYRWRGLTVALPVAILLGGAGLWGYAENKQLNARFETIDQSVQLVEAMTTNMYSALETLADSGDARRELLLRSRDFGEKLQGYQDDTASFDFWNLILEGDTYIDTWAESDAAGSVAAADIDANIGRARDKYEKAVAIARTRTEQWPDDIAWKVKLAVALGKLSPTAATDAGACAAQQEVVALNDAILGQQDETYEWRYQSFSGLNNLARIVNTACQPRAKNHIGFVKASVLAEMMANDKATSHARLRAIAAELIENARQLRGFPFVSRVASQREAEIAAAQGVTAVRLIERAQKAKPSNETLQELAIARYELSIALFGMAEFAKSDSMLAAAIADYKTLIGQDPVNKRQYESEVAELILTRQSIADCITSPALCTDEQP
jgi:hypothetical protein